MKNRKYIYFFVLLFLLMLTTSCSLIKNIRVNIYDGNGQIIETLKVGKGNKIDLTTYGVIQKDSDENYDYYFKGWSCGDTVTVKQSMDIYPEYEKYPLGLTFITDYSEKTNQSAFYQIKEYTGNATFLEIPKTVGYPLKKDERIRTYLPVEKIQEKVFKSNTTLEEVILPEGLKEIGRQSFYYCENIIKVNIPTTVVKIEEGAFINCFSLKEVNIKENKNIQLGKDIFYNCKNLEKAYLPDTLTIIPKGLFEGCEKLESVDINTTIIKVSEYAFSGCKNLDLSFIDFSKLETIEFSAFAYCKVPSVLDLSNIDFDGSAFNYCPTLEEVKFNENIVKIEGFDYCENLSKINFSELINLEMISGLNDSNIKILDLSSNKKIESVQITNNKKTFEELILFYDIKYRPSAKKTVILNGEIKGNFSSECEEVVLPYGITEITSAIFSKCRNLRTLIIPSSVTTIANQAFKNCESLQTITIPSSVTTIGEYAFSGCSSLEQVIFENGTKIKTIEIGTFSRCNSLSDINISKCQELTMIKEYAFYDCYSLINFEFETLSKLTTIEDNAFSGTNIRIMKLPNQVTTLGAGLPDLISFIYIPSGLNYTTNLDNLKTVFAFRNGQTPKTQNIYINITADQIYYDEDGFVYLLNQDSTATIIRYCGLNRDVVTKEEITVNNKKYNVTTIGYYAFSGDFITSLKISDSVTTALGFLFDGLAFNNYSTTTYNSLRILSVGKNFEFELITKFENITGLQVISGYREQWLSPFNVINSYKDPKIYFDSNRYNLNNLISAEGLNNVSGIILGTKVHAVSTTYETYPSYKETTTQFTNDFLTELNDAKYDIMYEIIDNFIFTKDLKKCLGYVGEYKTVLQLPELEEGYECYFIPNEYHCYTYKASENVTFYYE